MIKSSDCVTLLKKLELHIPCLTVNLTPSDLQIDEDVFPSLERVSSAFK